MLENFAVLSEDSYIYNQDREVYDAIVAEQKRQDEHIELIASENIVSRAVLEAMGSVMTNKYAEGYPHKRYYGGCENMDTVEELAQERAKKLFNCERRQTCNHILGHRQTWRYSSDFFNRETLC